MTSRLEGGSPGVVNGEKGRSQGDFGAKNGLLRGMQSLTVYDAEIERI